VCLEQHPSATSAVASEKVADSVSLEHDPALAPAPFEVLADRALVSARAMDLAKTLEDLVDMDCVELRHRSCPPPRLSADPPCDYMVWKQVLLTFCLKDLEQRVIGEEENTSPTHDFSVVA
jgi:hypothetical protein